MLKRAARNAQDAGAPEDTLEEGVSPLEELAEQAARRPDVPSDAHPPARLERKRLPLEVHGPVDGGVTGVVVGGGGGGRQRRRGGRRRVDGREVVLLLQHQSCCLLLAGVSCAS